MVNKYFYHHGRCRLVARSTDLSSLSFRILTILLTVACLVAGHAEAYAQSCTSGFTSDWIRNAGYVDQSNGKVTYTYQIGSMSSSMVNAILTAIARWNAKSSDMVIVGSPGAGQDLHFSIDNSIDDPCAAKWQSGTEISMTSDLQTLAKARWRIAITLTILMVILYFGFISLIAYNKELLARRLLPGLSLGILLGVVVIAGSWLSTWVYVSWANKHYDQQLKDLGK